MFENVNLPRVVRVRSTVPVTEELEAFDMMARFLAAEKAKQFSHDFAGQAYLASSSQVWTDLRQACNSLLDGKDLPREPVAAWKEQMEAATASETPISVKEESVGDEDESSDSSEKAKDKKSAKKAKKEKKEAKKAKKAAKKAKKEKRRKSKGDA